MDKSIEEQLKLSLESTQEFFDMWMKNYSSTFGKLAQIPTIGPIREKQEKMMKSFPLYANLCTTWIDSNINFQCVFIEAMRRTYEKTINDIKIDKDSISPETYKEFYKTWIDTYSETFKDFMKSGHFLSDMNKIVSHFMDLQKYNREMIEENFLRPSNLPTKTDIDDINKELYLLKKTVKDLNNKIEELSELSKKLSRQYSLADNALTDSPNNSDSSDSPDSTNSSDSTNNSDRTEQETK